MTGGRDDALFIPEDGRFVPTARAGSPWADGIVHGGPPAGLLARAVEQLAGAPEMHVARLTIDLFRPVPNQPLAVAARSVREGRRIHVVEASLLADGVEVCRASGLLLRHAPLAPPPGADGSSTPPGPDGIETTPLGGSRGHSARGPAEARASGGEHIPAAGDHAPPRPMRPGFHTTVEARWVSRPGEGGAAVAWLRTPVPLVAGEELTPLVRVAALADFVNPLSGAGARAGAGFINVDSSIHLHRLPRGEWIGMHVERTVGPDGIGVAHAVLYDTAGPVGRCTQTALANELR